jgi:hypothetical protein
MSRNAQGNTRSVRRHPRGGFTIAEPIPGTPSARKYEGHFETFGEARAELNRRNGGKILV